MKCQICGTENPETAKFCNECGAKIERKEENPDVSNFDEETLLCPSCKAEIKKKNKFCPICGVKQETKIFCEGCGAELLSNVKFCPSCGTPRNGNVQQKVSIVEPVTQTDSISVPLDNDEKKDAMLEAIKKDNIKTVEAILNSGYKVNKRILDVTPLGLAAIFDSTNVAKFLIQRGAPVKGIASNCNTIPHHNPLMLAALNNSLKVAEVLIEAGADVNSANDNGRTAMKIAEARNHTEMMDLLQKNGAKVTSVRSVLQKGLSVVAVLSGNPGLAIQAGAKDADIDNLYLRENY